MEWYIQIEKLIGRAEFCTNVLMHSRKKTTFVRDFCDFMYVLGKKLPKYPAEETEVLSLMDRVADSKRIALGVIYWFTLSLLAL